MFLTPLTRPRIPLHPSGPGRLPMSTTVPPVAPPPASPSPEELTVLLGRIEKDPDARARVFEAVYRDLRKIAHSVSTLRYWPPVRLTA